MTRIRPPEFHPVLLVIDMQNGYCTRGGSYEEYGANIGAENDAHRLDKVHEAGVDETDHHDSGGAGTLNNTGDQGSKGKAVDGPPGKGAQYALNAGPHGLL